MANYYKIMTLESITLQMKRQKSYVYLLAEVETHSLEFTILMK